MRNLSFSAVAVWLLLLQGAGTGVVRTGDVARVLSEQDIAAMVSALPAVAKPWLLNGDPGQLVFVQAIEVYLQPSSQKATLRRGTMTIVSRRTQTGQGWQASYSCEYAQVAIPGRSFDEIKGDQDANRPFQVLGTFADEELVRLVNVLRSRSSVALPGGGSTNVEALPILSVARQSATTVSVSLRVRVMQGQTVVLEKRGEDWVAVSIGRWAA